MDASAVIALSGVVATAVRANAGLAARPQSTAAPADPASTNATAAPISTFFISSYLSVLGPGPRPPRKQRNRSTASSRVRPSSRRERSSAWPRQDSARPSAKRGVNGTQLDSASVLDEELLTVAEMAQFLRLNEQTVRNWIFSTAFEVVP